MSCTLAFYQEVVCSSVVCKLLDLLEVVGASGFEPPTSWSRTTRIKSKLLNWLEFPVLPSH